ncbi:hypothetical protein MMC07_003820 [Pseudocyphellaria aurata]|nr:hypothetical protein [Pseudocyphellaria aurata]
MPFNDSDSSDEDAETYTTTKVLLGYASKEPTDDHFSQLGGRPTWLDTQIPPDSQLATCKVCQNMMAMLLQLNGDLPDRFPIHERRLYIFACKSKACRRKEGSIRAIRAVRAYKKTTGKGPENDGTKAPRQEAAQKPPPQNLGNTIFNSKPTPPTSGSANPFSIPIAPSPNPFSSANPFSPPRTTSVASNPSQTPPTDSLPVTFAEKVRLSSPPPDSAQPSSPWPPESAFPPPYPSYYLDADFETLDAPSPTQSPSNHTKFEDGQPSTSKSDEPADDADAFESPLDKTFHRFADRLAQNPLQVLRYEFGGSPLLYSKSDAVGKMFAQHPPPPPGNTNSINNKRITVKPRTPTEIPRCSACRAERVFELQLTPQAIAELEVDHEGIEGMDWGSVVLGVCSRDCEARGVPKGEVGWVEEWIGVQWEEIGGGGGGGRRRG